MSLRCRIFGCFDRAHDVVCERCGRHAYFDLQFAGWVEPLRRAWWRLRRQLCRRCAYCGVRLWPVVDRDGEFCSRECADLDDRIPF